MMKTIEALVAVFRWAAAFAIAAMMIVTCADVIMRAAGRPIWGAVEMVGFLAIIGVACSLPYVHVMKSHASVDMIIRRLNRRTRHRVDMATGLVSVILFVLISWQMFIYAHNLQQSGEVSMTLEFPAYLLVYVVAVSLAVLALAILAEVGRTWREAKNR